MSRKVSFFTKSNKVAVQGICDATKLGVALGQPCDGTPRHGGGIVSDMEVAGQCIVIRKSTADGKPWRNYGRISPANQPNKTYDVVGDGVMFPLVMCQSVVFVDEDDKPSQQAGKAK